MIPVRKSRAWLAGIAVGLLALAVEPTRGSAVDVEEADSLEQIVVTATRTPTLVADEPLRVEAVSTEEIEENLTVQPSAYAQRYRASQPLGGSRRWSQSVEILHLGHPEQWGRNRGLPSESEPVRNCV